jgi:hypothetical protein
MSKTTIETEMNDTEIDEIAADETELIPVKPDPKYTYEHVFKKPFNYNGKEYKTLHFNFEDLTGRDALEIENEMIQLGKQMMIASVYSGEYQIRMAAKACTEKIGSDALEMMPIYEHNKIRSRVRSFLLKSER